MKNILRSSILLSVLFTFSCEIPDASLSPEIGDATYQVDVIASDYFANPVSGNTLYISVFFELVDSSVQASDIERVSILDRNDDGWIFDSKNYDIGSYLEGNRFSAWNLHNYMHRVVLGEYRVAVTLKNGKTDEYAFIVTPPGENSLNGKDFAYSEAYTGVIYSSYVSALKVPTEMSAYRNGSSIISFSFKTLETKVIDGLFWLLDSSGTLIGYTAAWTTPEGPGFTSGAGVLLTDGSENTIEIQESNASMYAGYDFSQVSSVRIMYWEPHYGYRGSKVSVN